MECAARCRKTVRRGSCTGIIGAGSKCCSSVMISEPDRIQGGDLLSRKGDIGPAGDRRRRTIIKAYLVLIKGGSENRQPTCIEIDLRLARCSSCWWIGPIL